MLILTTMNFIKEIIYTIGTITFTISRSLKNWQIIDIDLTACSLTSVSSKVVNFSNKLSKQED